MACLKSRELRRLQCNVALLLKILYGIILRDIENVFCAYSKNLMNEHSHKLVKELHKLVLRKIFFFS